MIKPMSLCSVFEFKVLMRISCNNNNNNNNHLSSFVFVLKYKLICFINCNYVIIN